MKERTVKLRGLNLEIWRKDFEVDGDPKMTVNNAMDDLEKLGEGWRLPDYREMLIISHLVDLGILAEPSSREDYWTSFADPDYGGNHGVFSFDDRNFYSRFNNERLYVRPVRTI